MKNLENYLGLKWMLGNPAEDLCDRILLSFVKIGAVVGKNELKWFWCHGDKKE